MSEATTQDLKETDWDHEITNKRNLFSVNFAEIWAYRDLITSFVHRDLVASYKQTVLGPFWFVIQPLVSTATFTVVFGLISNMPTQGVPMFIFYMAGNTAWNYFQGALTRCSSVFNGNSGMFSKVYFPRLCVPIASIISLTINSALQFLMFLGFLAYFMIKGSNVHPTWAVLLFPVIVLQLALFGAGLGCIVSALTTRFRDLQLALGFGMQLWMYGSCVLYPRATALEKLPEQYHWLITLNPIVPAMEVMRGGFLGTEGVPYMAFGICTVIAVLVFLLGTVVFNRSEKDFADKI